MNEQLIENFRNQDLGVVLDLLNLNHIEIMTENVVHRDQGKFINMHIITKYKILIYSHYRKITKI